VMLAACHGSGREVGDAVMRRLSRLLGIFVAAVLYFTIVQHLASLYATEHHGVERFILMDGGIYTLLFWAGQIVLGGLLPLALVFRPAAAGSNRNATLASILVIIGGFAQIYVIVIGGQAYPLVLFPGMEVSSSFHDGVINGYTPSLPEIGLGLGGVALALIVVLFGLRVLRFLPSSLADAVIDPHHQAAGSRP